MIKMVIDKVFFVDMMTVQWVSSSFYVKILNHLFSCKVLIILRSMLISFDVFTECILLNQSVQTSLTWNCVAWL